MNMIDIETLMDCYAPMSINPLGGPKRKRRLADAPGLSDELWFQEGHPVQGRRNLCFWSQDMAGLPQV